MQNDKIIIKLWLINFIISINYCAENVKECKFYKSHDIWHIHVKWKFEKK